MALGFQSGAFQYGAFQQSARGSQGAGRWRKELSIADWLKLAEWRDELAQSQKKASPRVVAAVKRISRQVIEDVPPDVWVPPNVEMTAQAVAEGIGALLDYLWRVNALSEAARLAQIEADEDEENAVTILLLH